MAADPRTHLLPEEAGLLDRPEVRALPEDAQIEYVRSNRRVGLAVTRFAGGARLALLAAGGAAAIAQAVPFIASGEIAQGAIAGVAGAALLALAAVATRAWRRRLRDLARPFPGPE